LGCRVFTAIQHFREAGVIGHFGHRHAIVSQQFGGAAGRQDMHAQCGQFLCKFQNTGLVGYADQRAFDFGHVSLPPWLMNEKAVFTVA
jgi:hypothetical protein